MRAGHGLRLDEESKQRLADFGGRLREARIALGLSAAEIAERLPDSIRVTGASIRAYENGITKPGEPLVRAVERILLAEQKSQAVGIVINPGDLVDALSPATISDAVDALSDDDLRQEMVTMRARMKKLEGELERRSD